MTAYFVLASIGVLLVVLVSGRVAPAPLFVSWAVGFHLLGLVDQRVMLASYANPALATLVVLLLVSLALEKSPVLDRVSDALLKGRQGFAVFRLSGLTAMLSAFLNNTAVVGALLGVIARQKHIAPSRLLIPLSYAAVLGGVTTLVGTSTNLVVNSFAVEAGLPPIGMFDLAWAGVPIALACIAVLVVSSRLLPEHSVDLKASIQRYVLEARVMEDSPLAGKTIEQNRMRGLDGLFLLEIERQGRLISPVGPDEVLEYGDLLIFTGEVDKVSSLRQFVGLQVFGNGADVLLRSNLVEVVVTGESELINRTLRQVDFRTMFDAGVVGIRRGEREIRGQLGRVSIRAGDCLLLAVGGDFAQHRNLDRNFVIFSGAPIRPRFTPLQSRMALGGFGTVILLSALEWLSLFSGLLILAAGLLMTKMLTMGEIRRRFPFELVLVIGSALTIARVLEATGAAALVADAIQVVFAGYGVWGAFIGVYLLTLVLTEVVTNNAAAALAFPIALAAARSFGVDPTPFVLIVCYGASACFLIPFGYQTHLMVFSPGRYRVIDFVKVGLPISLVYSIVALLAVPFFFPF
ncbi:SLC13 family permease [Azoarcus communis]|uniref:SLC13 family permease n=1 Tax=Parazoarcus communis TaxID=41977 RepID=UPI0014599174|nr:SLC13 family permease [Parazoarcus communis]NMG47283.1 SLC13 family permease [Parazoarcus communis]